MRKRISDLRRDYQAGSLSIQDVDASPFIQFSNWMDEAIKAEVLEPNAMTLATVDGKGKPSARIVLLKGMDKRGLHFYTNYQSRKSKDIAMVPNVALVFNWLEQARQVRIEGRVELLEENLSDEYFASRPIKSRKGAWVSPQSQAIPNRDVLGDRAGKMEDILWAGATEIHRPPFWGGYRVVPTLFEFWQGRSSRLHDRLLYTLEEGEVWRIERIAP